MPTYNMTMSREFLSDLVQLPTAIQPRAIRTAERMIEDPWASELHPEKIRRAEEGVRSCRVDDSYRIVWKHIKPNDVILCLVDKHDDAYRRAARKAFTLHDGIVQVADIMEVGAKPREQTDSIFGWFRRGKEDVGTLFVGYRDQELLDLGVPSDVLPNIRSLEDVNQLELVERLLPQAVYDRLLEIALDVVDRPVVPDGELQQSIERYQGGQDLYRFLDSDEFMRALDGSMEEWMLFLAPYQKQLVMRAYNGSARIKGVAGSGKTVVAIHRARYLARRALTQGQKILFLTYGSRLPNVVYYLLEHLAGENAPELEAVECLTIHQWCYRFLAKHGKRPVMDDTGDVYRAALDHALADATLRHPGLRLWSRPPSFFAEEIRYAIKGRAITTLEQYLALERSGRGTPLQEVERRAAYAVFEGYQKYLQERHLWDYDDYILEALHLLASGAAAGDYLAAVVDEIQDLSEAVMQLIRHLIPPGPDDLFLVGDGLQRIYPGGYALGRLDINITGRGTLLRKNYRNTQQILRAAHAMMSDQSVDDMDEAEGEIPEPEYSVRQGGVPVLRHFRTPDLELQWIGQEIQKLKTQRGYKDRDFALLYRWRWPYKDLILQHLGSQTQLVELGREADSYFGPGAKHTTFHSAKGLEFKVVFVLGVADGQFVPKDDWSLKGEELDDYLARERRLLYVAMTRPRDLLYLTCSRGRPSRFLSNVPKEFLRRE